MGDGGALIDEHDAAVIHGRSLLLVDDEEDIRGTIARLLRASYPGLRVEVAPHAESALDQIARAPEPFDIILSDYRMPGMDGVQFLQQCREVTPESYRVMMTAYPDRQVSQDAAELAAVETFLTKPVDPTSILLNIKDLLRQRWLDAAEN